MMGVMQPPLDELATPTVLEQHLAINSDPCPMCHYNLHKLKGSSCPECGHELVLRVAVTNPRMAAFYTGLLGLAAGAGFASLLTLWIVYGMLRHGFGAGGPSVTEFIILPIEAVVLGGLALVWIRDSGRIRRLPALFRWALACCAWMSSIGGTAFFVWFVGGL